MLEEPKQYDYSLLTEMFKEKSNDFLDISLSARRIAVLSLIPRAAEATGVNADTLRGMWWVESRSGHNEMLISPTGAKGDWQFTKQTLANVFMHNGPEIANNLEESGFMAEADNVRMYTRAFRNLAIEKFNIDATGLALDEPESNYLFRTRTLSWQDDIVPASSGILRDPKSFEKFDNGATMAGNNQYIPPDNFLERLDETRMNLPATTTFAAAYYIREIGEDTGVDVGDYKNAGSLYAGYNIGPENAARLGGSLASTPNAMAAIGFEAENNPYFFRNNATGTRALGNYQEALDQWREFGIYTLQPSPELVEGVARGLRENRSDPDINPYDIYNNVMESRGLYARAQTMQEVRASLLGYPTTQPLNIPSYTLPERSISEALYNIGIDDVPRINPNDYRVSSSDRGLLGISLPDPNADPNAPPQPK